MCVYMYVYVYVWVCLCNLCWLISLDIFESLLNFYVCSLDGRSGYHNLPAMCIREVSHICLININSQHCVGVCC